jgi:hypothetical protein
MSKMQTLDASQAVASVAYRLSEVNAIYPITPSSNNWLASLSAQRKLDLAVTGGVHTPEDAVKVVRAGASGRDVRARQLHTCASCRAGRPDPVLSPRSEHRDGANPFWS